MQAGEVKIRLMMDLLDLQEKMRRAPGIVSEGMDRIRQSVGVAHAALGALGVGISFAGLVAMANGIKDAAAQVDRLASLSDASATEFQRYAAGAKTVGVEMDKFSDIMKDTQDKLGDYMLSGGGELKDFFEQIAPKVGVTAEQFKNLSGPQALQLFYTTLERAGVGQKVMVNQMEAIADEASALAPLLANGGAEFQRLGDAAEQAGAILSDDLIDASKAYKAELDLMEITLTGVKNTIAEAVLPTLTEMAAASREGLSDGFESVSRWVADNRDELLQTWGAVQQLASEVWDVVSAAGALAVGIGKWAVESGAVKIVLQSVGLLVAGLRDGVDIFGAAFAAVGSTIFKTVLTPIRLVYEGFGKAAALVGADQQAVAYERIAASIKNFSDAGGTYAAEVAARFARGDTAVARFSAGLNTATVAAEQASGAARRTRDNLGSGIASGAAAAKQAEKAAEAAKKLAADGQALAASLLAQDSGLSGDFSKKWDQLSAAYRAGGINLDTLVQAQAALLAQQPAMKAAADAEAKALQESAKAYADTLDARDQSLQSILQQVEQEREHVASLGLSKEALAELAAAKIDDSAASLERRAALADDIDWSGALGDSYRAEAKALRELAALKRDGAVKEAAVDAAQKAADEWQKATEQIGQSLSDALMQGGKSAWEYIVGLFRTMVLRPVIQAVVNLVVGAATSALGFSGAAQAGQGGASALGTLGNAASLYSTISGYGSQFMAGVGSTLGFGAASSGAIAANAALGAQIGIDAASAAAASSAAGAAAGSSTLASIGAAAPYAAIALAAVALGDKLFSSRGERHSGGIASTSGAAGWDAALRIAGDDAAARDLTARQNADVNSTLATTVTSLGQLADAAFAAAGSTRKFDLTLGFAADSGDSSYGYFDLIDKASGGAVSSYRNRSLSGDAGAAMTQLSNDAAAAILQALRQADIPAWATTALNDLQSLPALQQLEQFSALAQALQANLTGVNRMFDTLGMTLLATDDAGVTWAKKFAQQFGGADAMTQAMNAYYQAFYSDAERTAITTRQLSEELARLGAGPLPATRDEFRALVEGARAAGDDALLAGLLKVAPAFASISDDAARMADNVTRLAGAFDDAAGRFATLAEYQFAQDMADTAIGKAMGRQLGIPGFAAGGDHAGGWRLVGERGPEIEATGPARIFSADQTRDILGGRSIGGAGGNGQLLAELRAELAEVRRVLSDLQRTNSAENNAIAMHVAKAARLLEEIDDRGLGVTNAKTGDGLTVTVAA